MTVTRKRPRVRRLLPRMLALATAPALAAATLTLVATPSAAQDYERIINGTFDNGETSPWWSTENVALSVVDGELCADVTGGTANLWDALFGQGQVPLEQGAEYTLSFDARADSAQTIQTTVQQTEEPYTSTLAEQLEVGTTTQSYSYTFTSSLGIDTGQVTFQLGGSPADNMLCFDNISLVGGEEPPGGDDPAPATPVRVNQVGYLPDGPKVATVVSDATGSLPWELRDAGGTAVASGLTTVHGNDPASGDHVHQVDFSEYSEPGSGYVLVVGGISGERPEQPEQHSHPFDISADIYDQLRYDALTFFYHQRSGIEIEAQYVGAEYARPAGHVGVSPNQGDISVPCLPDLPCDYSLDVSGGWYDAGDHGKYVVAGGLATWILMNEYERAVHAEDADAAALADGTLPLPEQNNGVPDILDEARWELEFLLSMQVPEGEPLSGMAHHKIHDAQWTGIPMPPHEDPQPRYLHAPSTAATLNLAATAAQCARIYDEFDPAFADTCLAAAERAWDAAQAHPQRYADPNDTSGGGAYADDDVTDEFYWAAAELYITTDDEEYLQALNANPHRGADVFDPVSFGWATTAALGRLSLATVPNDLSADRRGSVRASVVSGADEYRQDIGSQGYPVPYARPDGSYEWGSNGYVISNAMVMAAAYDITGDDKYADGAVTTLGYILGRNALDQSYVSGYGENASRNQHHRFWAHQADASFPHPPAGSLAGGPNSALQDPVAQRELQGCAPQKCYIDDIGSYSTNEVTIYWNAPLAWVAAFAADVAGDSGDNGDDDGEPPNTGSCTVDYTIVNQWPSGFTGSIRLTNNGDPVDSWTLEFDLTAGQQVTNGWAGEWSQDGEHVTVTSMPWNSALDTGESVTAGFNGTHDGDNPEPSAFALNNTSCGTG